MTTQRLDETRLAELVKDAQQRRDFSSSELGGMIDHICRVALNLEAYRKWDECIQMELYGNGALAAINAIAKTAQPENKSLFDYLYTTVINSYRATLKKMFRNPLSVDNDFLETLSTAEPAYVREKRRLAKGIIDRHRDEILEAAVSRKQALLKNVVNRAAKAFAELLTMKQVNELIRLARKAREAIC